MKKMIRIRLNRLEEAFEKEEAPYLVKGFFRDYVTAFKRLKNPTLAQDEEFAKTYTRYVEYLNYFKEKQKDAGKI